MAVNYHPLKYLRMFSVSLNYVNFSALETDGAVGGGKQGVIPAHSDVVAGEEFCSALANNNRAILRSLAAVKLYAAELWVAVSAVPGRALSFFMCHI